MCLYLYIHNKYTHYINKNLFWMRLITINRLGALVYILFQYFFSSFSFSLTTCVKLTETKMKIN